MKMCLLLHISVIFHYFGADFFQKLSTFNSLQSPTQIVNGNIKGKLTIVILQKSISNNFRDVCTDIGSRFLLVLKQHVKDST